MRKLGITLLAVIIGLLGYGITQTGASASAANPKVVVCKNTRTPAGTLHHIVIVSENSLRNTPYVAPPDGDSWTDAHGQTTVGSVAVRYALPGEQAGHLDANAVCAGQEPPPVGVPFAFSDPIPPTCESAGDFIQQSIPDGVIFTIEPEFTGPGTYTLTATLEDPNATFEDGTTVKTKVITVSPQLAADLAECLPSEGPPGTNPPGSTPPVAFPPDNPGNPDNPDNPGNPANPGNPGAAVPTEVDAGLSGSADTSWGWGIVGLGALLLGTTALLLGRPRGAHQR